MEYTPKAFGDEVYDMSRRLMALELLLSPIIKILREAKAANDNELIAQSFKQRFVAAEKLAEARGRDIIELHNKLKQLDVELATYKDAFSANPRRDRNE